MNRQDRDRYDYGRYDGYNNDDHYHSARNLTDEFEREYREHRGYSSNDDGRYGMRHSYHEGNDMEDTYQRLRRDDDSFRDRTDYMRGDRDNNEYFYGNYGRADNDSDNYRGNMGMYRRDRDDYSSRSNNYSRDYDSYSRNRDRNDDWDSRPLRSDNRGQYNPYNSDNYSRTREDYTSNSWSGDNDRSYRNYDRDRDRNRDRDRDYSNGASYSGPYGINRDYDYDSRDTYRNRYY